MSEVGVNPYRTVTIQNQYLEQIKDQSKTVEGRIFKGIFTNLRQGDRIQFVETGNPHNFVHCKVLSIERYNSFREMLQGEGFLNCLPAAASLQKAIDIYNNIPGYSHQVTIHGALAIRIQVVK